MRKRMLILPLGSALIHSATVLLLFSAAVLRVSAGTQTYTIEDINDPWFAKFPPPPPAHVQEWSFIATKSGQEAVHTITSTNLRNLSVTVANEGPDTVHAPYVVGPHGWDFRRLDVLVNQLVKGAASNREKFFRIFEWQSKHMYRVAGDIRTCNEYSNGDVTFLLNKYGQALCSSTAKVVCGLLHEVEPRGSMYGRLVDLHAHTVGEAFYDQQWHAYDCTFRWAYFDHDGHTPVTWAQVRGDLSLLDELQPITAWANEMEKYYVGPVKELKYWNENEPMAGNWDMNWNLAPDESVTMYFDMRGRADMASFEFNTKQFNEPRDYGSAVFTWKPDFTSDKFERFVVDKQNVRRTGEGFVPRDGSKPAFVVLEVNKFPWQFCGADIKAHFLTAGKVYIAPATNFFATNYSPTLKWQLLSPDRKEYGASSIEGKPAYWVKFEFSGAGSGLRDAELSSEIQMSPWAMPGLEYGVNHIRFEAKDFGPAPGPRNSRQRVKVTYRYDDRSTYHHYEPASSRYGRHIPYRVGGLLESAELKAGFWEKLTQTPTHTEPVAVSIYQITGSKPRTNVRTLFQRDLPVGYYNWYWDGKDDQGNQCPADEMYSYRIAEGKKDVYGERLYLFRELWPEENQSP